MITRSQVADLRPGDVVEVTAGSAWPNTVLRGEVFGPESNRCVGPMSLSENWGELVTLTVVSRAPRPLYVNHPRMNPLPGDVVRMENDGGRVVMLTEADGWLDRHGHEHDPKRKDGLRLLVDGETGMPPAVTP